MAHNCPNCKIEILRNTAHFCDNCGVKLRTILSDEPTESIPEAQSGADTGATKAQPEADVTEDRGATKARPEAQITEDDGATQVRPEAQITEDKGATKARPEAQLIDDDDEKVEASPASQPTLTDQQWDYKDSKIGQVLGNRYRIEKVLGKGGFGAVYLVHDTSPLDRECVVKEMLIPNVTTPQKLKLYRANFEREAKLLAQLNTPGHPNIPEIYDYFSDDTGNYLVMKFIEGRNLKDVTETGDSLLSTEEVTRYAVDLCSALHYMHAHGNEPVMHRDIKPANILLADDGRIWLVDFGLAKAKPVEDSEEMTVTKIFGSVGYTPIEQWLGEATPASDIYALGATLHHLLTGLDPLNAYGDEFHISKLQQMHGQFIPIRKVNKNVSKTLEGIVASATGADSEQRPTALQLRQQFDIFVSDRTETPLFTFKSGEVATTKGKLIDLCDQYRPEARGYLYRGDFERWFNLTNRNDLAEAATQAIKRGRNQNDGLDRFLKLILPSLFFRRLSRAGLHLARLSLQIGLIALIIILLLLFIGSWVLRWNIANAIAKYPLTVNQVHHYTGTELTDIAQMNTRPLFDAIWIDLQPKDRTDVTIRWNGLLFRFPLTLTLDEENHKLKFQMSEINGLPLYFIASNIARGIGDGLDGALCQADVSDLDLNANEISFRAGVGKTGDCPQPGVETSSENRPQEVPDATAGETLLIIVNEHSQTIILKLSNLQGDQQTLNLIPDNQVVLRLEPGQYDYVATTDDRLLGNVGQISWDAGTYFLYIR